MKKTVSIFLLFLFLFLVLWMTPVKFYFYKRFIHDIVPDTLNLPEKNKNVIRYIELKGKSLAPSYKTVVCTEYVINVLKNFNTLSESDKAKIRIITNKDLKTLILNDSDVIKGVYNYLVSTDNGIPINNINDVRSGDFIQFWNIGFGSPIGHCGIIRGIDIENGLICLYSSSPTTDGFGKQMYVIPERYYIARLK